MNRYLKTSVLATVAVLGWSTGAQAFSFIFAGESNGVDLVTHASNYTGAGGNIQVTVGIDQTSAFATDMAVSVQNVVNTYNGMAPTTNNFSLGQIGGGQIDFESVLLHEMGHSLGLSHVNLASESGLGAPQNSGAASTDGANNVFNVNAGADGVFGSSDDVRGDDVNLVYFRDGVNDPFDTNLGVVDSTTYSRDIADLPVGDLSAAIASREVATLLGEGNTEAVLVQGSLFGEVQRTLAANDVAGLMYAQSGIDSLAGTADDYTLELVFVGETNSADILIDFDSSQTGFAVSQSGGQFISDNDVSITSNSVFFNDSFNWFFNDTSNAAMPVPLPASGWALLFGLAGLTYVARRQPRRAHAAS